MYIDGSHGNNVQPDTGSGNTSAPFQDGTPLCRLTHGRLRADSGRARDARAHATRLPAPCRQGRVKLIAAAHRDNVGDRRQADAVAAETVSLISERRLYRADAVSHESLIIDGPDYAARMRQLRTAHEKSVAQLRAGEYEKAIFILSGSDQALAPVLGDTPSHPGMTTVFTGHKATQDMKHAKRLPTITALPVSAAMTKDERASFDRRTELVLVPGVAHDLTDVKIAELVTQYRDKGYPPLPPVDRHTVAVILGGDVPGDDGRVRRFTEDDARELARDIARLELAAGEHRRFIVTNGPRTGKHGRDGAEHSPSPHRAGCPDSVTRAFVETLSTYTGVEVHVFDFQYDQTPSVYAPLVDAFKRAPESGGLYVPGDSVSMMSEIGSHLPSTMIICHIPSMDGGHRSQVQAMVAESGIAWLDGNGKLHRREGSAASAPVPAARRIAEAIVARMSG